MCPGVPRSLYRYIDIGKKYLIWGNKGRGGKIGGGTQGQVI